MPDRLEVTDPDGLVSVVFRWSPPAGTTARAVLHIIHGWCEHAMRYDRPARQLAAAGIAVYADDHRGHGETGTRNGTTGHLGPGGHEGAVEAVHAVSRAAREAEDDRLPFFALGHSWGSLLLGRYLERWSGELAGAVLTGTTYLALGQKGDRNYNARFEPSRTPYDWLSRDADEVDRYAADPFCGFDVMKEPIDLKAPKRGIDAPIRASLPLLIVNGADDPVGGEEAARLLAERYVERGLTDVTWKAYAGARHELLNEIEPCRTEVLGDIRAWLDARIG